MAGTPSREQMRLAVYMTAWSRGARGAAYSSDLMADEDFKAGYEAGRKAKAAAYSAACERYGTILDPLRA